MHKEFGYIICDYVSFRFEGLFNAKNKKLFRHSINLGERYTI